MFRPYTDTTLRKFDISADGGQTWTTQWMTFSEMKAEFQRYNFAIYYDVLQSCDKCGTLFHLYYNTTDNHTAYWNKCDCEAEFHPYSPDQPTFSEFMDFLTEKTASPTVEDMNTIAHNIAEFLKYSPFDNITVSSGHYIVREFPDGGIRTVDVYKSTDGGTPHYTVLCLYEDDQSDWKYTETLSIEELAEVLKEVYTDDTGMEPDGEDTPIQEESTTKDWYEEILCLFIDRPNYNIKVAGDTILCRTEDVANAVAEIIERLYAAQDEDVQICTGYYDPEEDARSGETDELTGWHYVDIA